jgi:hypothetical protein
MKRERSTWWGVHRDKNEVRLFRTLGHLEQLKHWLLA